MYTYGLNLSRLSALPFLRHVLVADQDAAAGRHLQAGDHAQRRRLAAAARPQQGHELAGLDREGDAVDGDHRAERLAHLLEDHAGRLGTDCHGTASPVTATGLRSLRPRRPRRRSPTTSWTRDRKSTRLNSSH